MTRTEVKKKSRNEPVHVESEDSIDVGLFRNDRYVSRKFEEDSFERRYEKVKNMQTIQSVDIVKKECDVNPYSNVIRNELPVSGFKKESNVIAYGNASGFKKEHNVDIPYNTTTVMRREVAGSGYKQRHEDFRIVKNDGFMFRSNALNMKVLNSALIPNSENTNVIKSDEVFELKTQMAMKNKKIHELENVTK
jgi:hypothetical protein